MTFSFVVASNDPRVLGSCLLASPDLRATVAPEISVQENPSSASRAYNRGIDATRGDILVFAHQDLYLPAGWLERLSAEIGAIERTDPNWGVLGLWGVDGQGQYAGWTYSSGLGRTLGGPQPSPRPVRTLDEVLLVIRRAPGLRFDEALPGFHMYGTDLCLTAESRGLKNYALSCFALHNSNGIRQLPWAFWSACWFVRRKWSRALPIHAPCTTVSHWPFGTIRQMLLRQLQFSLRRTSVGKRVNDPEALIRQLERDGRLLVGKIAP